MQKLSEDFALDFAKKMNFDNDDDEIIFYSKLKKKRSENFRKILKRLMKSEILIKYRQKWASWSEILKILMFWKQFKSRAEYTSEWCGLGWVLASKTQPANSVGWPGWIGLWIELNWVFFRIEMGFSPQNNDYLNALKIDFKTFYFWWKFFIKNSY